MIRVATVFSGIGAIEHALDRMAVPHEIVFACDNGDVDLDIPTVPVSIDACKKELEREKDEIKKTETSSPDKDSQAYIAQIKRMLSGADAQMDALLDALPDIDDVVVTGTWPEMFDILDNAIAVSTPSRQKKFKELKKAACIEQSDEGRVFQILRLVNAMTDDKLNIDSPNVRFIAEKADIDLKKIEKLGLDVVDRLRMINEKWLYYTCSKDLRGITDYAEKKKYVDNLYAGKEKQNKVKQSYMANYDLPDEHFHWNIAFLDGKQYEGKVDLFVGGSPCQSFSVAGKRRGLEDTRGTLFYEYARLIKEIQPKVFIYENVKAILSNDEGRTWETMKAVFESLGYNVYYTYNGKPSVLNAKDYGVPQSRSRMFVVGFRKDINLDHEFTFPDPIPLEHKMKDYLLDTVPEHYCLSDRAKELVTNEMRLRKKYTQVDGEIALCERKQQQFNLTGDFVTVKNSVIPDKYFLSEKLERYVMAGGTKGYMHEPETDQDVAKAILQSSHKMHRAGIDNYVHTEGRLRKLTPRECLRLMGFTDDFKIVVADTPMYQQAGNSIVVDVLMAIMRQVFEAVGTDDLSRI